ncbi:MAG: hypothetical protein J5I94_16905 [Phaeodactylibacter sp.]|nr:hypothetical protein [Phaeodactylibacter sp.]
MKIRKLFLCLFCVFLQHLLPAQAVNRSLHLQPVSMADQLLPTTINGAWLISGSAGQYMGYPVFRPWIGLADAEGNLIWERYLNEAEAVELGQINSLSEDPLGEVFYLAGAVSGCDYLIPGILYMLDKNGQTLWYKSSEPFYNPIATALPLQGVLAAEKGAGLIEWHSMSGEMAASFDFSDTFNLQLVEMLTTSLNTAALLGQQQVMLTEWTDGEVEVTAGISLEGGKSISRGPSGQLAVLAGEKLYLLDGALSIRQELALGSYGSFEKVSCNAGRCYVGGQSPDGSYIALALDEELGYLHTFDMGPAYYHPNSLAAQDDGGLMALGSALPQETEATPYVSQGVFNTTDGSDIFLRSWDAAGNPALSRRDIAVEEVIIAQHNITTGEENCYPTGGGYMQGAFSGIEVQVRNNGAETIGRIELNAVFKPCWFICYTQQNISRTFSGLSLGPGESATLSLGNIQTWPLPLQGTFNFCVWASGPDGQLDDQFGDNRACVSVVVSDVGEEGAGSFALFPNPASGLLEVQFEKPLMDEAVLEIRNPMGQCLYRETLARGRAGVRLPVEQLPAGLYYLAVHSGPEAQALPWIKK